MLPDAPVLVSFLLAAGVICITPGPDMFYVLSFGVSRGVRGGIAAASGVAIGMLVHTLIAAVGLSVILRAASWPIVALQYAGALYLVIMGVQLIRHGVDRGELTAAGEARGYRIIVQSALVNISNPKILIFFLAFLPQFVSTASPSGMAAQTLMLGLTFTGMGFVTDALIGFFSGSLARGIISDRKKRRVLNLLSGTILCLLGVGLAVAKL